MYLCQVQYYREKMLSLKQISVGSTSGSRICVAGGGGGGQEILIEVFANRAKWSGANEVSLCRPGSKTHLRALEAIGFYIAKYAFSLLYVPFYANFEMQGRIQGGPGGPGPP